ncbi:GntR family transcriptional regulator [Desulfobacula sp.]|uniref:GntR family transcriptional regulator n=1 Tax=Desulfobacula sp. TaxID=2593537 RepID=UPI00260F68E0|nr:GntR family transcriptional regulator [Desulfobacula sp.]
MSAKGSKVFRQIKKRIIEGFYRQGSTLVEKDICKEFEISRTPYRETLIMLEMEGLVEIHPKKGVVVTSFDLNDLRDIFEMRSILEKAAGELALQRIKPYHLKIFDEIVQNLHGLSLDDYEGYKKLDALFHKTFNEVHGNRLLKEFLSRVQDKCIRLWNSIDENDDTIKTLRRDSVLSLEMVCEAMVKEDKQGVIKGLNQHFNAYLQIMISHLIGGYGMADSLKNPLD